ncbi:hypothetical protein [Streptomyces sp. AK08-02]|uniref:hypothetical protein n=1 Tax=Streptomyces sp. AK08-02 TaxID=3028654 RepID=UPI0029BF54A9|nr:hypothetical protein [Streptomyces sp. AK08-02]MDX3753757.1 hypothetical protein [Streptomyces sp. AK08-02]
MKLSRRTAATALAALSLVGTAVATAPASAAATAPGAYNGACGPGFSVVNWSQVKSSPTNVIGTVYVTFNYSTEDNCAVLVRTKPGTRMYMEVTLDTWPNSSKPVEDHGSFKEYAGPIYLDAATVNGQCLTWSGSIDIYYDGASGLCS